jgi:hypothetical protein
MQERYLGVQMPGQFENRFEVFRPHAIGINWDEDLADGRLTAGTLEQRIVAQLRFDRPSGLCTKPNGFGVCCHERSTAFPG